MITLGVVILAAGASTRMGRPKLLLPWGDDSVLGHLIREWQCLGAKQIAVVCAEHDQAINGELERLRFPKDNRVFNPTPAEGMFNSIQCAARWPRWVAGSTHWVIVLGDQPHLRTATLHELLEFAASRPHKICQPSRRGRPRHPVLLPKQIFQQLATTTVVNLKQFLQSVPVEVALCEMSDPGLDFDIDEPADYEKARQLYFKKNSQ